VKNPSDAETATTVMAFSRDPHLCHPKCRPKPELDEGEPNDRTSPTAGKPERRTLIMVASQFEFRDWKADLWLLVTPTMRRADNVQPHLRARSLKLF
jgi:hypothetical protein